VYVHVVSCYKLKSTYIEPWGYSSVFLNVRFPWVSDDVVIVVVSVLES